MPDLTTLRAGDSVHFRCGGSAIASSHSGQKPGGYIKVSFDGGDVCSHKFTPEGKFNGSYLHPFDIISIEPKPFDWSEVKPGMCFTDYDGRNVWIIGRHPRGGFVASTSKTLVCTDQLIFVYEEKLTPCPEHDIEARND